MFLLLYDKADDNTLSWLTKYALPVSPLCWIHNAGVKGTFHIKINSSVLKQLSERIENSSYKFINYVEEKIKTNSMRGRSKQLILNKLDVIIQCSQNLTTIEYAQDLRTIVSNSSHKPSEPEKIKKDTELGIDIETVQEYLLRLAKKPSIH